MLAPLISTGTGASGTGGALASAANAYNAMATSLTKQVNAGLEMGQTASGSTDFFKLPTSGAAALGLTIIPTKASEIASRAIGSGALDGSIADQISLIGKKAGSPDALWSSTVTLIGATTKTELKLSVLNDLAATSASTNQLANSSVDLDEENVNLLMSQQAYNAAARVLTTMDEMLDTLINRTGLVGR